MNWIPILLMVCAGIAAAALVDGQPEAKAGRLVVAVGVFTLAYVAGLLRGLWYGK